MCIRDRLCVDQLSFQYTKEQPLLKEVSFQIKPNQFVGIVGESGSGKSTIAKLIMGYHQDYQGEIRIQTHQRYDIDDTVFFNHFVYCLLYTSSVNNYNDLKGIEFVLRFQ